MRNVSKTLLVAAAAVAAAGCHSKDQPPQDQNIVVDNGVLDNADIEALPPDESSETTSNELVNGDDNPDVGDLNSSTNAD